MRSFEKKPNRKKPYTLIVLFLIVIGLTLCVRALILGGSHGISAKKLRCVVTQNVTPFGDRVLYYDGDTLFCLSSSGNELWNYTLGSKASFDAGSEAVAVWTESQLHIINRNGKATYNDRLTESVQFVRTGSKYIAVVQGDTSSPTLVVKDLDGVIVDQESAAYEGLVMLDVGFFGDGEYLWTIALDVYGSVSEITLNTYRVGQLNTGEVNLGEPITYAVVYSGSALNIVNTRQLRLYDYRGTQDTASTKLVYGWQLIDSASSNASAYLLFGAASQVNEGVLSELRLLHGNTDNRYTLPDTCVGAAIRNKKIYGFSNDSLYRSDISSQRFTALSLPVDGEVTDYLGMLSNGVALLATGSDIWAVTLP